MSPKSIRSSAGVDFYLIRGSSIPHESAFQTASRSVHPFLQGSPVCLADRHTDHETCDMCSNKPHLCMQNMRLWLKQIHQLNPPISPS